MMERKDLYKNVVILLLATALVWVSVYAVRKKTQYEDAQQDLKVMTVLEKNCRTSIEFLQNLEWKQK